MAVVPSKPGAKKREARKSLRQPGWITLEGGFARRTCVVENISSSGAKITVWPIRNVMHEIASTGTIAAGDGIASGAAGVAATAVVATAAAAGTLLGIAVNGATGGAVARFLGR